MNDRGFVLLMTMVSVLAFTLLGLGAMQLAGNQKIMAEEQGFSTQALWLADGGVQRALVQLPSTSLNEDVDANNYIHTDIISGFSHLWNIDSKRRVNNKSRRINAVVSDIGYDIFKAFTYKGTIVKKYDEQITGGYAHVPDLTFESIFGIPLSTLYNSSTTTKLTNDVVPPGGFTGVTYVTAPSTGLNYTNTGNELSGDGLLIIDCSSFIPGSGENAVCVNINTNSFSGVVWIAGNGGVDFTGSTGGALQGAVFVATSGANSFLGNNDTVTYNDEAIYNAVGLLPGEHSGVPVIFSWNEVL